MSTVLSEGQVHGRSTIVVGVGDCAVSGDPNSLMVTYALGTCIGVTAYDPVAKIGGMLHYMLPAAFSEDMRDEKPEMFGDTGVSLLLDTLEEHGAKADQLILCAAGGAEILDDAGRFHIGQRNLGALRDVLSARGLGLSADETGDTISRSIRLDLATGEVMVRHRSREWQIWTR